MILIKYLQLWLSNILNVIEKYKIFFIVNGLYNQKTKLDVN